MSDFTECSICLETFKDPKALPCIHTFCLQCLDKHFEGNPPEEVKCPLCRNAFTIPPGGIKDLPNNFFVQQLLQVKESAIVARKRNFCNKRLCELCADSDTEIRSYCTKCDKHICDRCSVEHSQSKVCRSHQVIRKADAPNPIKRLKLALDYCDQHSGEQNRFYCNDCKKAVCHVCYVNAHSGHPWVDKLDEMLRDQLKCDVENLSTSVEKKLQRVRKLEVAQDKFAEAVATAAREISRKYDQLVSPLQLQRDELMTELNAFKDKIINEVQAEKGEIENQLTTTDCFKTYVLNFIDKGAIFREARDIHARAKELVNTRYEPDCHRLSLVEVTFKPSVQTLFQISVTDTVENFIGELALNDSEKSKDTRPCDFSEFVGSQSVRGVIPSLGLTDVSGSTVLDSELFVLLRTAEINVYKSDDFTLIRKLRVAGSTHLECIASCSRYNCLYLSDFSEKIHRYDLKSDVVVNWASGGCCYDLTVTRAHTVLATLYDAKRIREYATHGDLIREISLDGSVECPLDCIQLSTGYYVVSLIGTQDRVCIIDRKGRIIQSYDGSQGPSSGRVFHSSCMAVDGHDNVLVADYLNNRIRLLSDTLTYISDFVVPGHQLVRPTRLQLDVVNRRLYVGDSSGRTFVLGSSLQ